MKTKVLSFIILLIVGWFYSAHAENKTETFIVKGGDCDECKVYIEESALSVTGVSIADWNRETKELQVVFDDSQTNVDAIQQVIADNGNDTPNHKAQNEAYNKIPECCKYRHEN